MAYAASYFRTLRKIVEQPDISPAFRSGWLPHFGGSFETAIVQFSIRSLLRSRQHRMIFAFYLGMGLALAILFLNAPPELSGPDAGGPWDTLSVPLLASTIMLMGLWVVGARVVFSLPLDLRANWIFRTIPFRAGRPCLNARRRARRRAIGFLGGRAGVVSWPRSAGGLAVSRARHAWGGLAGLGRGRGGFF